jgi:Recombinase
MAYFERIRDIVSQPFSPDVIRRRTADGWQMVAIEWRRELPDAEAPIDAGFNEDIPYGLRISNDCQRLEPDPVEHRILMLMMELLAQDFSYAQIVASLNEQGFRMRNGRPWNRVAVFQMIPRLIEVGPRCFSSGEWAERRQHFEPPPPAIPLRSPAAPTHTWRGLFTRHPRPSDQ